MSNPTEGTNTCEACGKTFEGEHHSLSTCKDDTVGVTICEACEHAHATEQALRDTIIARQGINGALILVRRKLDAARKRRAESRANMMRAVSADDAHMFSGKAKAWNYVVQELEHLELELLGQA